MPYKDGAWGKRAKQRSKRRLEYFREYSRKRYDPHRATDYNRVSGIGSKGEILSLKLLEGSELQRKPTHDIIWNGKRIEVKTGKPRFSDGGYWRFTISIKQFEADYFLFLCLDENEKIEKSYLIPVSRIERRNIPRQNVYIGVKDKYSTFIMK